jgi:hypothetical protein
MEIPCSRSEKPMWKRLEQRLLLLLCIAFLVFAGCAHTRAGRAKQKTRVLIVAGSVVVVVGFALIIGAASDCEDTGSCATPNGAPGTQAIQFRRFAP